MSLASDVHCSEFWCREDAVIGALEDTEILTKKFYPIFAPVDLASLPNQQIYLRLMVDGMTSLPFSADTVKL